MPKKNNSFREGFIFGFTGKKLSGVGGKSKKGKKPMTEREAAERRKRMNTKYDQYGNLK